MHGKERVISPIMEHLTGCCVNVRDDFNTDKMGTFTLETSRPGTQVETARAKALKAIEISGGDLGLASEGSFSPYPSYPFINYNRELVILLDRYNDIETIGESISLETNLDQRKVRDINDAIGFANKIGFPAHFLIANPAGVNNTFIKGINSWKSLAEAISWGKTNSPHEEVVLQTDMRAHANPTRMKNIMIATEDLAMKVLSLCPNCGMYGFALSSYKHGVPCEWCKKPTDMIVAEIYTCQKCKLSIEVSKQTGYADPGMCDYCNP
jgi:hypothetical protein